MKAILVAILVGMVFMAGCGTSAPAAGKNTPIPKATATVKPTQTPKPTETPKATPTVGMTSSEREYVATIGKQMDTMGPSLKRASELMLSPKFSDIGWTVDLAIEFATWHQAYKDIQVLKPSARYKEFHTLYSSALANFDGAATDMAAGIDKVDAKRIEAGAVKMTDGSRLLKEATAVLDKVG